MELDFFKKTRILDGGMGQELLARGMKPNGTLWSANAVLKEEYHQLLLDTHSDFYKGRGRSNCNSYIYYEKKKIKRQFC
jgi:homocysteine S-methyltransferase